MTQISKDWVTTVEAVAIIGKSEGWLRLRAKEGKLERVKVGNLIYYRREQIENIKHQEGRG